jgi:hypothetical protein
MRPDQLCNAMASMPADAGLSDQRKSLGGQPEHLEVLSKAIGDLAASRPPFAHEVMVRLADLRRRQGRIEEAERLFREAESHPMASSAWPSCRWIAMIPVGPFLWPSKCCDLPLANKTQRAAALELA